jgi:predicted ATPase/DNA-binding winged helix-turn-helix (wHTH) protein
MLHPGTTVLCFGPFTLDLAAAQLRRDGAEVALRPKAFELLVALARRPQQLVTKEELLDTVWGRRFITEGVIKSSVSELRQALGDDPKAPRWIETVARRGYRFGAAVVDGPSMRTPAPATHTATPAAAAQAAAGPGNLPAPLTPAIGRDAELAALAALLPAQRLLTLTGPSGMGKTRLALALAWAQRTAWRDGVWFVELAALVADAAADAAGAAALRATLVQSLLLHSGAGASAATLARTLQPLHLLLVLDNAEHLLAPLAPLLTLLLAQAPGVHVLVTSQEPLHIPGEQVFRLAPLTLPVTADEDTAEQLMASSAVRLFVARVAARLPGFSLGPHQRQAVAQICRELDGLPLALELAAARVPVLGVHGMAELLQAGGDRLQLLNQGARTAAPRQRTLRAALTWSHGLLDERQRRVLRRLAVFRGGFSLAQAQAVCSDDTLDRWAVLDAVQALVDKSLLGALADSAGAAAFAPAAQPRLHMLESVRAFAHEQLTLAGEANRIATRHATTVAAYWAQADAGALGVPALQWLHLHGAEVDNLRAALRWTRDAVPVPGEPQAALPSLSALVANTAMLWHRAGLYAEGRSWCDAARGGPAPLAGHAQGQEPELNPGLELAQATLGAYGNVYAAPQALACAERAAAGFEACGDAQRQYYALYLVYQSGLRANLQAGAAPQAALLAQMQALERPDWAEVLTRFARAVRGYEHRRCGRSDDYLAYCRDELARCQRMDAVVEAWPPAQGLMLCEHDRGQLGAALVVGRQALADIRARGRLRQHGAFHALWTTMLAQSGDCAGARQALAEALPMLRGAGTAWMAHVALAWLAAQEARPADAAQLLGWHTAAQQAQQRAHAGGTIARAVQALHTRLDAQLGSAELARQQQMGAALDDDAAERLALTAAH